MSEPKQDVSYVLVSTVFATGMKLLNPKRVYKMGRSPDSDVVLPHGEVSRLHAKLGWISDAMYIKDMKSANHTFVNGEAVDKRALQDNDMLTLGPFELRYREFDGDVSSLFKDARTNDMTTVPSFSSALKDERVENFSGQFYHNDLISLCGLLAANKRDGVLRVKVGGEVEGHLAFLGGRIVEAVIGELEGTQAAERILIQTRGEFEFEAGPPEGESAAPLFPDTQAFLDGLSEKDGQGDTIVGARD